MTTCPTTPDWTIPGSDDQPILGNTDLPPGGIEAARGVVLLCHGFKGYKDYGFFPPLAAALAAAGLIAHRFNFSHSGMTANPATFERPDLFERDTWSKQIADVVALAAAIKSRALPGADLPLVLFGHSRGGITALLAAMELGDAVDGLITAAAPHRACTLDDDQKARLRKSGRLVSPSARTGQDLCIGADWLAEIEAHPDRFDPVRATSRLRCRHLVIHGRDDTTVPWTAAHAIHDAPGTGPHRTLEILDRAGHTFNAPNPMPPDAPIPPATARFLDTVVRFATTSCTPAP